MQQASTSQSPSQLPAAQAVAGGNSFWEEILFVLLFGLAVIGSMVLLPVLAGIQ